MKTVVVTGGTKGLGRALTLAFVDAGFRPLALYHRDEIAAQALRDELTARARPGRVLRHDVSDETRAMELARAQEVVDADEIVLVNNACATFTPRPLHQLTWADFQPLLDTALKGSVLVTSALLRTLVARKGLVVSVLTSALTRPPKGFGAYVTAKGAVQAFTRALHAEYGAQGLRALSVSPRFMDTPLTAAWDPRLRAIMAGDGLPGADEVAREVVSLCSRAACDASLGMGEDHPL